MEFICICLVLVQFLFNAFGLWYSLTSCLHSLQCVLKHYIVSIQLLCNPLSIETCNTITRSFLTDKFSSLPSASFQLNSPLVSSVAVLCSWWTRAWKYLFGGEPTPRWAAPQRPGQTHTSPAKLKHVCRVALKEKHSETSKAGAILQLLSAVGLSKLWRSSS